MDITGIIGKLDGDVKKKILAAATVEEVKNIAKKAGVELTDEQAKMAQKVIKEAGSKVDADTISKAADLLKKIK